MKTHDELVVQARAAMEANAQIRGPYTLGSKLFEELTQITMNFRSACSPEAYLELVAERERLEEALKEAREALKPFAEEAEYWIGGSDSDNPFDVYFTVADLHEAARALKTDPAPGDE